MTALGDLLTLTDDEVAAIAVTSGRPWLGPLPTLDLRSTDGLTKATARGVRSLAIRDLVIDGHAQPALAAVASALSGQPAIRTFISDNLPIPSEQARVTTFFAAGSDDIIIDVSSPAGVHSVGAVKPDEVRRILLDATNDAVTNSAAAPALAWCVLSPTTGDEAVALIVNAGAYSIYDIDGDGALTKRRTDDLETALNSVIENGLERAR